MEGSISAFCGAISSFLSHLQSTSDALADSLRRRPVPLDSAAAAFLQRLDHRVAAAGADLELLEDMAMGTVSVAELLGHCSEVYRRNQAYLDLLQDRLASFGYVPEVDVEDDENEDLDANSKFLSPENGFERPFMGCGSALVAGSARRRLDDDPLFEDSVSLQSIGLSDACLATLASEAEGDLASPGMHPEDLVSSNNGVTCESKILHLSSDEDKISESKGLLQGDLIRDKCASRASIEISKDDYDKLPTYVKSLASWEDLQEAVTRMNSGLRERGIFTESASFSQDEAEALGLGRKAKSYVLALIRMNRLAVETVGGSVVYRVVVNDGNARSG